MMIRWLSEVWLSITLDAGRKPPRLWRMLFGRSESHRRFAARIDQLDAALKDQAESSQQALAEEPWPIGDYKKAAWSASDHNPFVRQPIWRPIASAALALCVLVSAIVYFAKPADPRMDVDVVYNATDQSITEVLDTLARQVRATNDALREQTLPIAKVPNELPDIDRAINRVGQAVETPIRLQMQQFAEDMTRPWAYLADQLPRPVLSYDRAAKQG